MDTRSRLLEAARGLFITQGFRGTSTRAIAAQAGGNLSLIKYYFGSKEGLLREVLRPEIESVRALIDALDRDEPPSAGQLEAFFLGLARHIDANRRFFRLVFAELLREGSPLSQELLEPIRGNQAVGRRLLLRAKDAGMLRDVDIEVALMGIIGSLLFYHLGYPLASMLVGPRSPAVIDRIGLASADLFLHGILKHPGDPAAGTGKETAR